VAARKFTAEQDRLFKLGWTDGSRDRKAGVVDSVAGSIFGTWGPQRSDNDYREGYKLGCEGRPCVRS
jgi:hypothetical protein